MINTTPQAGRRMGISTAPRMFARATTAATLVGFSAFSILFFLGASVQPAFTIPVVTIESAAEWNAFVEAGLGSLMRFPGSRLPRSPRGRMEDQTAAAVGTIPASVTTVSTIAEGNTEFLLPLDAMTGTPVLIADRVLGEDLPTFNDDLSSDLALAAFARTLAADMDSLDIPPSDTTTRAKFLPSRPRPSPIARPFPERISPLYGQPTRGIQRVVTVDSTKNEVLIREQINGRDVRVPYRMSLDDYIAGRYNYERDRRTAKKASEYSLEQGDDLANLLKNITEIDIPIAPNPLMSIFGDRSRISVRINGAIDINAGFKIESSDQQSVFLRPTQFSPNFKQQVQINVNGLVGDKLSIRADWSTERTFDYENQLKIKYTGYEDEIVQSVEAGNVSLQTPSTLIQGSGALFGIKAEFQAGPLRLQTIASQKKGESSRLSINGGAQEQKFERHAYEYSDNHYFIDTGYRDIDLNSGHSPYEAYYNYRALYPNSKSPVVVRADLYIKEIEVWLSRPATSGVVTDPDERDAVAFIDNPDAYLPGGTFPTTYDTYLDPNSRVDPKSGEIEVGRFKRLQKDVDYFLNAVTGIITLNSSIQDDQVLAVAYRVEGPTVESTDDLIYGTFAGDPRLKTYQNDKNETVPSRQVLKLVKPKNLGPSFDKAWKLKVRSIYSLNTRNLTAADLANFKIVYRSGGQPDNEILPNTDAQLLRLFGLDYSDDNGGPPDGRIDFLPGLTVNPVRGEIIFPTLAPWDDGMKELYVSLFAGDVSEIADYTYPEVYTQTKTQARQSSRDKIVISGTTRGSASAVYNLGFNVVAGSVRVYMNGSPLTPGVDYTVDEQVGTVRITREEALVPEAKVEIEYEKQDLFTFASKTLVGVRGEVDLGETSFLGFTYMSLNQKTLSDKVRIGEEPISNSMFGVDAKTMLDMPVITDALNMLPFISTKEKSSLTLQGEAAMVMPEQSSKTSTIPSDGGEGIAYLDDFEGSRIFIPLQTAYSVWRLGSVPNVLPNNSAANDTIMQTNRAKLDWYNLPITAVSDRTVRVDDIWPEKSVAREDQRVTVLDLDFYPGQRGQYNYNPDLGLQRRNWASIQRLLPVNATNLVDGNFNYIELWMKVENLPAGGKMIIDLGKISEDVVPDAKLNTEDDVLPGSIRNGILDPQEDVGLDMLTDDQERSAYAAQIAAGLIPSDDPSGDNFAYDPNNWTKFNGTQGNLDDPAGQFPDTEDLNNNAVLDLANDYFRYVIDLDANRYDPASPDRNPYVVGGGHNGWYQFRIPLATPDEVVGGPALDNVEYLRVILTDIDQGDPAAKGTVRIAEFNFVGNQWYERVRNDDMFAVSVVNVEDNPNEYTVPEGVIRPRDRTRPDQEIYGNEQSLSLDFTDLPTDTLREAYRIFPGNGIDLFNYRQLKMYVHGDQNLQGRNYEMVMRFGIDTSNFYEYRMLVEPGWSPNNEVAIDFSQLTAVKSLIDSASGYNAFPVRGKQNAWFWVHGNPDIVRVQFISVGVRNLEQNEISGRLWINELRVIQPNSKNGYAYNASMNLRLADIADISANVNHTDPFFHGLSERFSATRAWTTNWSMTTTLNVDKAFPEDWKGTQVRVTYAHAENLTKPLLVPGQPDVEVEGAVAALADKMRAEGKPQREIDEATRNARVATQTLSIRDSWAIPTIRLKAPGESWLIKDVVNRLELSYNYTVTRYRDPIFRSRRNWQWQARVGYGYDFGREAYIKPFSIFDGIFLLDFYKDAKWYFLPTRIAVDAGLERSRIEEVEREPLRYRPYTRTFLHNRSANMAFTISEESILNLSGNYSTSLRSSLLGLETDFLRDENGDIKMDPVYNLPMIAQRQSSAIFNDIFFGRSGGLYFGIPTNYQQQFSLSSRPIVPGFFDLDRHLDFNLSYQVSYNWQQNIQQEDQGRTASYNASINAQMTMKLKALFDPLFGERKSADAPVPPRKPTPGRRSGTVPPEPEPDPQPPVGEKLDEKRMQELNTMPIDQLLRLLEQRNPGKSEELMEKYRPYLELEQEFIEIKNRAAAESELERVVQLNEQLQKARQEIAAIIRGESELGELPELDQPGEGGGIDVGQYLADLAYYAIKVPFLDYDNVAFNFSQTNSSQVAGVRGETGFSTFWTSVPFGNPPDADAGPSRLYQLGLISDPNPSSGRIAFRSSFPFIGIDDYSRGLRAPNPTGTYVDNYTQGNTFSIKTNRPLWEGARLDLNWDLKWSLNKNYQIRTDPLGNQTIASVTTTGKLERSFMTFPDFLFFSFFNTNMESVNARFQELVGNTNDKRTESEKLAEAFEDGFEAVPWLQDVLGSFFPRLNYGLRWDGLEKWALLEGLADRISLEHRYTSNFATGFRNSQDTGERITETEQVSYGFQPLIGLALAFRQVWGGDLSVNTRWDKKGTFSLNTSSSNIVEDNSNELSLTADFKKNGFEMPMFGLSLKNDIQFTFAFTLNKTASRIYSITNLGNGGQPREGITRISIEPRVKYSVSQRVQASLFYRYQRTRPDADVGSRIPGSTIHEGGLEIRITIAGS